MTAHKILIGSAAAFFVFYGGWELAGYTKTGQVGALLRCVVALLVAVVFGLYFLYLRRKRTISALAEGLTKPQRPS